MRTIYENKDLATPQLPARTLRLKPRRAAKPAKRRKGVARGSANR